MNMNFENSYFSKKSILIFENYFSKVINIFETHMKNIKHWGQIF